MKRVNKTKWNSILILLILSLSIQVNAQSNKGKMAGRGAGQGALIGAIAGAVFGGGDFIGDAAEGALIGGGIGALSGALEGGGMDRQAQEELDQLVQEFGEDNLRGYVELMTCNYEKSIALFKVGEVSNNSDHRLAGLWLQAVAEKDRRNLEAVADLYPIIIERDPDIDDEQQASIAIDQYVLVLREDRRANQLSSCY
jgi:hypothetical protein